MNGVLPKLRVAGVCAAGLLLALPTAHACMHPPRGYPGKLGSTVQEYLLYRDGDLVRLVANQRVAADRDLPGELAWVIPLPSMPLEYRTEKDSLFPWLFHATENRGLHLMRGGGARKATLGSKGFKVHRRVLVGDYEIQPIEVLDAAAGKEINEWLFRNGYHRVPVRGLKYYLRQGACFLAVKVKGLKDREQQLRPLHIAYRSSEMRLPLKFFANAGEFDVYLYTVEGGEAHPDRSGLARWGLHYSHGFPADSAFLAKLDLKGLPSQGIRIARYIGPWINSPRNRIAKWKDDPLLSE